MGIIAIDPGNVMSGWAILGDDYKPLFFGKTENNELLEWFEMHRKELPKLAYVEMVASYGMAVGQTVFETCVWIGRFTQYLDSIGIKVKYVKRKEYVVEFCGTAKAKDPNVIQYLIDRFDPFAPNHGKGTKKEPGWFYGFAKDVWQAYAVGVYALDKEKEE